MPGVDFCRLLPKVELHVHLEGSIRPETLIQLAQKHSVSLPANSVSGLKDWFTFKDFPHFVEIYVALSSCIKTPEDIEFIAREFLQGQADQNILWSEVTYTATTIARQSGIPWDEQFDALFRAIKWGQSELGVGMGLIIDIVRGRPIEEAMTTVEWVSKGFGQGVVALGLAGNEGVGETKIYQPAFDIALSQDIPIIPHAGETQGAYSVWDCLEATQCKRIGHGIRCLEDAQLVKELRKLGTVLEVCPSSNVCLTPIPNLSAHPIGEMVEQGLAVTINSDDPPLFNTTLSDEYARCSAAFGWDEKTLRGFVKTAAEASLCADRAGLLERLEA